MCEVLDRARSGAEGLMDYNKLGTGTPLEWEAGPLGLEKVYLACRNSVLVALRAVCGEVGGAQCASHPWAGGPSRLASLLVIISGRPERCTPAVCICTLFDHTYQCLSRKL